VGWSAGYRPPPESDLIDEILLAAGKALYLANMFESKCSNVLRVANFEDIIQNDPVITLEQISALLPNAKMLGKTLQELFARTDMNVRQEQAMLLEKAREARNYIAHEGAGAIGDLWSYSVKHKLKALRKLHAKVIDLAKGDNIASTWIYQIEEPREPLPFSTDYPDKVEYWIFGHMPREWLDHDWEPDHRPPRTIVAAMSYEPWYSRPCRCPHEADEY
jgi:hypothetical protein